MNDDDTTRIDMHESEPQPGRTARSTSRSALVIGGAALALGLTAFGISAAVAGGSGGEVSAPNTVASTDASATPDAPTSPSDEATPSETKDGTADADAGPLVCGPAGERPPAPKDGDRPPAPQDGEKPPAPKAGDKHPAPKDGEKPDAPKPPTPGEK